MSWLEEMHLRDLDDGHHLEATCLRCLHTWRESPAQLLSQAAHANVRLDEAARRLACTRFGCRHVGVRLALVRKDDTSGFVGGMP